MTHALAEPGHSMGELAFGLIALGLLAFSYLFTVYVVLRGLRWVDAWWKARRSAGEVAEAPEDFDTQPRQREPISDEELTAILDATQERTDDHFVLWQAEVDERPGVHKYMRRMDRWSR